MTIGSLFAGIGAFDLGFQQAGFETLWQVEIGFSDSVRYRMIGNSLAVPVAKWIADRIAKVIHIDSQGKMTEKREE